MKKMILTTILLSLTLITACGDDARDVDSNIDSFEYSSSTVTTAKVEKPMCSEGTTREKAFCLIKKEKYAEAEKLLASNKDENKVVSVLHTYTSCMNGSAMTDECMDVSDSIFDLNSNDDIDGEEMFLLINTLADKRILEARRSTAQAIEEYNSKYFIPEIGMTEEKVLESTWGKPQKINKRTNQYGVHEQWVYGFGRYVYLDDGIVTSIQE